MSGKKHALYWISREEASVGGRDSVHTLGLLGRKIPCRREYASKFPKVSCPPTMIICMKMKNYGVINVGIGVLRHEGKRQKALYSIHR